MNMVKITKSYTISIEKDGQMITVDQDEVQMIKGFLEEAIREKGSEVRKAAGKTKVSMSEEKRMQISEHLGRRLSKRPQTLSSLLAGVSYVPNALPAIRKMLEDRKDVAKKAVGKRTLYFRK
jgi:hypothetical protein